MLPPIRRSAGGKKSRLSSTRWDAPAKETICRALKHLEWLYGSLLVTGFIYLLLSQTSVAPLKLFTCGMNPESRASTDGGFHADIWVLRLYYLSMLETTQDHIVLSYLIRRTCLRKQNPLISVHIHENPIVSPLKINFSISQCIWCCLAMFGQSPPLSRSAKSRNLCWVPTASSKAIRLTSSESGRAMSTRRLVRLDGN